MKTPAHLVEGIQVMIHDLQTQRLEVISVPADEIKHVGHKQRQVISRNPEWYQTLCSNHTKVRTDTRKRVGHCKHDTKISRARTMGVLVHLAAGGSCSKYAEELLGYAQEILEEQEVEDARYD